MLSRHSVLITGAPSGIGAVDADCLARSGSDAGRVERDRRRTKIALQRGIRLTGQGQTCLEDDIRLEERCKERARIVHELHDTLFQGFLGASLLLDQAVEQTPSDSPFRPALSGALRLARRAIDEGRAAMRGIHPASPAPSSLEDALSNLLNEVAPGRGARLRIFIQGESRSLNPAIQEQLFLIGREAVMNALRHSEATKIEVEVQYLRTLLRVLVRDNGCGINPEAVQKESDSHWGLRGMRERAENIGARFGIWSRIGAGTEVHVAVSVDVAKRQPMIAVLRKGGARDDEPEMHPSLERRRPPAVPGGCRHHHQLPGRNVAGWDCLERQGRD
jgi:signal transduction histidine kinase